MLGSNYFRGNFGDFLVNVERATSPLRVLITGSEIFKTGNCFHSNVEQITTSPHPPDQKKPRKSLLIWQSIKKTGIHVGREALVLYIRGKILFLFLFGLKVS